MDEANVFFNGIILAADDRLTARVAEQRSYFAWLRWITITGGIAIVIVVGLAVASVARYTRELSAAHRDLAALNSGLEDRVRERTADLVRANDEVQRFAYIVTHDLRAPLVNIMGFTGELEAGVASLQTLIEKSGIGSDASDPLVANARAAAAEDMPEAIGFIRSSTRKMDGLINAILQLVAGGTQAASARNHPACRVDRKHRLAASNIGSRKPAVRSTSISASPGSYRTVLRSSRSSPTFLTMPSNTARASDRCGSRSVPK